MLVELERISKELAVDYSEYGLLQRYKAEAHEKWSVLQLVYKDAQSSFSVQALP